MLAVPWAIIHNHKIMDLFLGSQKCFSKALKRVWFPLVLLSTAKEACISLQSPVWFETFRESRLHFHVLPNPTFLILLKLMSCNCCHI